MVENSCLFGFVIKTLQHLRVAVHSFQSLNRDLAPNAGVDCTIHHTHAAFAQDVDDLVLAEMFYVRVHNFTVCLYRRKLQGLKRTVQWTADVELLAQEAPRLLPLRTRRSGS